MYCLCCCLRQGEKGLSSLLGELGSNSIVLSAAAKDVCIKTYTLQTKAIQCPFLFQRELMAPKSPMWFIYIDCDTGSHQKSLCHAKITFTCAHGQVEYTSLLAQSEPILPVVNSTIAFGFKIFTGPKKRKKSGSLGFSYSPLYFYVILIQLHNCQKYSLDIFTNITKETEGSIKIYNLQWRSI